MYIFLKEAIILTPFIKSKWLQSICFSKPNALRLKGKMIKTNIYFCKNLKSIFSGSREKRFIIKEKPWN